MSKEHPVPQERIFYCPCGHQMASPMLPGERPPVGTFDFCLGFVQMFIIYQALRRYRK